MENQPPKRILALDGGGIRGALTLGFLEKLEELIREKEGKPKLLLCEYFDLIGGTSTGAIIAAGLSIGKTAGEMKDLYMDIGDTIFWRVNYNPFKWLKARYSHEPLDKALRGVFNDIQMGDDEIKTGLCIVAKRADTFSTWPIINHPGGKYFKYNKHMFLREAVRASAAAPTFFKPKQIFIDDKGNKGTFIDGGLSLANNPSLQLFLIATLQGFPYRWPLGEDKISLTSVGTGISDKKVDPDKIANYGLTNWASQIPNLFMEDANFLNQTILQYLSNSPTAKEIDGEIGDLSEDMLTGTAALHYLRYNIKLERKELEELEFKFTDEEIKSLHKMDKTENKHRLYDIGSKAAEKYVLKDHIK